MSEKFEKLDIDIFDEDADAIVVPVSSNKDLIGRGLDHQLNEAMKGRLAELRKKAAENYKPGEVICYPDRYEVDGKPQYIITAVTGFSSREKEASLRRLRECYTKAVTEFAKISEGRIKFPLLGGGHVKQGNESELNDDMLIKCAKEGILEGIRTAEAKGRKIEAVLCLKEMPIKSRRECKEYLKKAKTRFNKQDEEEIRYHLYTIAEYNALDMAYSDYAGMAESWCKSYRKIKKEIEEGISEYEGTEKEFYSGVLEGMISEWSGKNKEHKIGDLAAACSVSEGQFRKIRKGEYRLSRKNAICLGLMMELKQEDRMRLVCCSDESHPYPSDRWEVLIEQCACEQNEWKHIDRTVKRITGISLREYFDKEWDGRRNKYENDR